MYELKPCPFCGGEALVVEHPFSPQMSTYGVECLSCGVMTPSNYIAKVGAIGAWNRRSDENNQNN